MHSLSKGILSVPKALVLTALGDDVTLPVRVLSLVEITCPHTLHKANCVPDTQIQSFGPENMPESKTVPVSVWQSLILEGGKLLSGPTILLPSLTFSHHLPTGTINRRVQHRTTLSTHSEILGVLSSLFTLFHRYLITTSCCTESSSLHHGHLSRSHGSADAQSRHHDT